MTGAGVAWELRVARALGLPPLVLGTIVCLFLIAAFHTLHWLLGSWAWVPDPETGLAIESDARMAIIVSVLIGYAIEVGRSGTLAGFRARQGLGLEDPSIDLERDDTRAFETPLERLRASRMVMLGAACLTLAVVLALARLFPSGPRGAADLIWFALVLPLLFGLVARAAYETLIASRLTARRIEREVEVDLLDLEPLVGVGRVALRGSLHWIVGVSIGALVFLSPDVAAALAPLMAVTLAVALPSLLLPVRGVRRRIRAAKQAELAVVAKALRRARDAAVKRDPSAPGRLTDLLSYRAYLKGLSEWPFPAATYRRFGLYLLIPLGSWIGGALVERSLSAMLD